MLSTPAYHSRHIPKEWVNSETLSGKNVLLNGLCDTLDSEVLKKLKDCGVELIETRVVWWEIEKTSGQLDFTCLERRLDKIEKADLKAGVFPWFQHPPKWFDSKHLEHIRFRCLEHDQDSTIISLWDPKTLDVYDKLYGELARKVGPRLSFLYAGISGDFGEICYPSGVNHYLFSPPHNHHGFWCGDCLARKSFAEKLQEKYGTLDDLNANWHTNYTEWSYDLMPSLPIDGCCAQRRYDFALWYIESLMNFTKSACGVICSHFKEIDIAVPVGFVDESLPVGQIKSLAVKAAAEFDMIIRWTGMAHLGSFEKSNVLARRFSSAAHFYNTEFATEAALILSEDNAANGLYESLANGASIIHDDPQNIFRAFDVHKKLRPKIIIDPPITSVAVFYPVETELLEGQILERSFPEKLTDFTATFVSRASEFRRVADYDICDSYMIKDGFLRGKTDIFFVINCSIPEDVVLLLIDFAKTCGRVWIYSDVEPILLEAYLKGEKKYFTDIGRHAGASFFQTADTNLPGIYYFNQYPEIEPYKSLKQKYGDNTTTFYTCHHDYISQYNSETQEIKLYPRLQDCMLLF